MASGAVMVRALAVGLMTGALAAAVAIVPALDVAGASRLAEYAALLIVIVGTEVGLRYAVLGRPTVSYGERIAAVASSALTACLVLAAGLWCLYGLWRPGLLAARYAALLGGLTGDGAATSATIADLIARRAQYLDPLFQALSGAVTALFFALLIGGYTVFRWRVATRMAAARRAVSSAAG